MAEAPKYFLYIDPTKCIGCRSCEIECAVQHSVSKNIYGAVQEVPKPRPRASVIPVDEIRVPMQCRHCEDAPCIAVCPTKALYKSDEGFVLVDELKCIGCRMCVVACPFGHPAFDYERKVVLKCDGCVDRVREGKVPACVEACPTGALTFGTLDEVLEKVRREGMSPFLYEAVKLIPGVEKALPPAKVESPLTKLLKMYESVRWY